MVTDLDVNVVITHSFVYVDTRSALHFLLRRVHCRRSAPFAGPLTVNKVEPPGFISEPDRVSHIDSAPTYLLVLVPKVPNFYQRRRSAAKAHSRRPGAVAQHSHKQNT
ncbi:MULTISPECIES: hypothetical protein [unclassified Pseudomonas]|uniref:hypothetical protein n=1 Tax=unclassified Pseudomonas TaxID=196821 RepID=UPI0011AFBD30|nr:MULTISPECIES: hypothetical protein [unclassified Pseudomonas]